MSENVIGYGLCLLAGIASTVATYLMRVSSLESGVATFFSLQRLMYLGAAVGAYGIGFIFYSLALRKLPMSLAYPVMTAMTMLMIALVGAVVLQESMGMMKILGIALLVLGAFLVAA